MHDLVLVFDLVILHGIKFLSQFFHLDVVFGAQFIETVSLCAIFIFKRLLLVPLLREDQVYQALAYAVHASCLICLLDRPKILLRLLADILAVPVGDLCIRKSFERVECILQVLKRCLRLLKILSLLFQSGLKTIDLSDLGLDFRLGIL